MALFDSFNMSKKKKFMQVSTRVSRGYWLYPTEGNSEPDSYIIYNTKKELGYLENYLKIHS